VTTSTPTRGAAVRFPFPPLLFIGPLAGTLALHHWLVPLNMPGQPVTTVAGVVLTVAGVAFSLSGVGAMIGHHTTVVPHHPVARLVTTGPYRLSRNPMYAGHVVAYLGVALWVGTWWPLIALPICVLATNRLVIAAEENYLTHKFGAEYLRYRSRVRRWI
jgi:protein-S-isoprenylcysteine O-methyltransferase Ste14